MTIKKNEIKKVASLIMLITGWSLIIDKIKIYATNYMPIDSVLLGIIIIAIALWIFEIR